MDRRASPCFVVVFWALVSSAPIAVAAEAPSASDAEIARLVGDVSPARLESTVRALAGFGTRHSLSSVDDPVTTTFLAPSSRR